MSSLESSYKSTWKKNIVISLVYLNKFTCIFWKYDQGYIKGEKKNPGLLPIVEELLKQAAV